MWYRSYRDHAIMPFPSFDTATNSWAPQANITWVAGAARKSAFVRFPMRVASETEAVDCALRAAEHWIDKNKGKNCEVWNELSGPETPIHARISGLLKQDARQTRRLQPVLSRNSAKSLTFDDFKANVASLVANASENSLLKSYAALIQLRKDSHCSWAQIKSKLKRSQESMAVLQSDRRRAKTTGLPLTPRDWRRII